MIISDNQKVAFMAQLSETLINPPTGTVVPFDSVITNAGDGFKPELGSFVAPVSGVYSISLVASSSPKKRSELVSIIISVACFENASLSYKNHYKAH